MTVSSTLKDLQRLWDKYQYIAGASAGLLVTGAALYSALPPAFATGIVAVAALAGVLGTLINRGEKVVAMRRRRDSRSESAVQKLKTTIDKYCEQERSGRNQWPWLAMSLIAYCGAFVAFAQYATSASVSLGPTAICAAWALIAMAVAGSFAEENPPVEGQQDVIELLLTRYQAQSASDYRRLVAKISRGGWSLEDLVKFAAAEEETQRQSEYRQFVNRYLEIRIRTN